MIIALIITALVWWGYFLKSHSIYKKDSAGFSDHFLFAWFLTIVQIIVIEMFCGLVLQNLRSELLGFLNVAVSILVIFRARGQMLAGKESLKTGILASKQILSGRNRLLLGAMLGSVLVLWTITRTVVAPPNAFDTLTYHLPISIKWFQENKITLVDEVPVGRMNYATKGPKLLNFWVLAFEKGNIELIEFSQYFGIILLLAAAYGILKRLGVRPRWRLLATLTILFIPLVMIEHYTLQDHVFLTAAHFALLKFLYDFLDDAFVSEKKAIIIISMAAAILLAAKFSAPAHVAAIGAFLLLLYPRKLASTIAKKSNISSFVAAIIFISLIGGIWYYANFQHYGSIFGPPQPQVYKQNKLLNNILEFPQRIQDTASQYNQDLVNISGFGIHTFGFGFVTALAALIFYRKDKRIWLLMGSATLLLMLYFSLYHTPYNYRLFLFVPISVLMTGFYFIDKSKSKLLKTLILIIVPLGMLFSLVTTVYSDYFQEPLLVYRNLMNLYPDDRTITRFDYSADKFDHDPSFLFIDQYIPVNEKILYITQSEEGYDDIVIAGYYDNKLKRQAIWGGELSQTQFFTPGGKPKPALISYMREHDISFFHNNVVFFNMYEVPLQLDGTPLIHITKNLYYLPKEGTQ